MDVRLSDGEIVTIHCPNTGSMKNCVVPDTPCWFSWSENPNRKLPGTIEITTTALGYLAGVNTSRPNQLVAEAVLAGRIPELAGYHTMKSEVKYGLESSRIDLLLENDDHHCYVEVKNVTLEIGHGVVAFPDAVTNRGTKHLRELMAIVASGHRAVLFFCVQHSGARRVVPAADIDPVYTDMLTRAVASGVEVIAYRCAISPHEITIAEAIAFSLDV